MVRHLPLLALALVACQSDPAEVEPDWPDMDGREALIRASLDLRGVRPNVDEYARLEADPDALDELIEEFLQSDRFGDRMADLYAEVFLTRTETWSVGPETYGVGITGPDFVNSVGDEVPQMVGHVARTDRPWTDMVRGDWTMANETLAAIWPLEYSGSGWQPSRYTDARPGAGALSTNSLWWRYGSTSSNANRKRANTVSRIFLCQDYLHRPIAFDRNVNLLDEGAVEDALRTNAGCVNCHAALDPLAGYFYGFWYYNDQLTAEVTNYHPERELLWRDYGPEPGYYGEPGFGLDELGYQLASDNRYVTCAVETVTSQLLRRDVGIDDDPRLLAHREAFLEGDLTLRSLARSVVNSPEYRAGATDDPLAVPRKLATADLLHDQIEGLTGFRWTTNGGLDLLQSERVGFRTLAGGADGVFVTQSATRPNATYVLVHSRLAEAAADFVVSRDLASSTPRLLRLADGNETPGGDTDAIVAQIQDLHWRIFGTRVAADGPEVEANLELWTDLYELDNDAAGAWTGLVTALLRDPDIILY